MNNSQRNLLCGAAALVLLVPAAPSRAQPYGSPGGYGGVPGPGAGYGPGPGYGPAPGYGNAPGPGYGGAVPPGGYGPGGYSSGGFGSGGPAPGSYGPGGYAPGGYGSGGSGFGGYAPGGYSGPGSPNAGYPPPGYPPPGYPPGYPGPVDPESVPTVAPPNDPVFNSGLPARSLRPPGTPSQIPQQNPGPFDPTIPTRRPRTLQDYSWTYIDAPAPRSIQLHDIVTILVDEKAELLVQSRYNRQRNLTYQAQLKSSCG